MRNTDKKKGVLKNTLKEFTITLLELFIVLYMLGVIPAFALIGLISLFF